MRTHVRQSESRTLVIGDIIDTRSVNFDPIKAIGRIRQDKGDGQFTVEYPDGELGVLAAPKEISFLTNSMYKEYVDEVRPKLEKNPDLSVSDVIKRVNHWIRKKKKSLPFQKHWENPEMDGVSEARKVLDLLEGFADAIPSTIRRPGGERELWIPINKRVGDLTDTEGNVVPTNQPLALNVLGISSSFATVGVLSGDEVGDTYQVSTKDLVSKGILVSQRESRELDVPTQHQIRVAKKTINTPDAILGVIGGMTKEEARKILARYGVSSREAMPRTAHDVMPGEFRR